MNIFECFKVGMVSRPQLVFNQHLWDINSAVSEMCSVTFSPVKALSELPNVITSKCLKLKIIGIEFGSSLGSSSGIGLTRLYECRCVTSTTDSTNMLTPEVKTYFSCYHECTFGILRFLQIIFIYPWIHWFTFVLLSLRCNWWLPIAVYSKQTVSGRKFNIANNFS